MGGRTTRVRPREAPHVTGLPIQLGPMAQAHTVLGSSRHQQPKPTNKVVRQDPDCVW